MDSMKLLKAVTIASLIIASQVVLTGCPKHDICPAYGKRYNKHHNKRKTRAEVQQQLDFSIAHHTTKQHSNM